MKMIEAEALVKALEDMMAVKTIEHKGLSRQADVLRDLGRSAPSFAVLDAMTASAADLNEARGYIKALGDVAKVLRKIIDNSGDDV